MESFFVQLWTVGSINFISSQIAVADVPSFPFIVICEGAIAVVEIIGHTCIMPVSLIKAFLLVIKNKLLYEIFHCIQLAFPRKFCV